MSDLRQASEVAAEIVDAIPAEWQHFKGHGGPHPTPPMDDRDDAIKAVTDAIQRDREDVALAMEELADDSEFHFGEKRCAKELRLLAAKVRGAK